MGILLTALLALHGAIHLLGFLKWSRLLLAQAHGDTRVVTPDELRTLPEPVAKWLEASDVVGRSRAFISDGEPLDRYSWY